MSIQEVVLAFAAGLAVGGLVAWLLRGVLARAAAARDAAELKTQLATLQTRLEERERQSETLRQVTTRHEHELEQALRDRDGVLGHARDEANRLRERLADLEARAEEERRAADEKLQLVQTAREQLANEFKALSAEVMQQSSQSFLELAKATLQTEPERAYGELAKRHQAFEALVQPVKESLERLDQKVQEVEKARTGDYHALAEQLRAVGEAQSLVRQETGNLVKALRTPNVRGFWGEVQLRRVVELAGMLRHCDFAEQESGQSERGALRPDLLVRLPGGRSIVVDAKTPLAAYLEAIEAPDEATRKQALRDHSRQVRDKVNGLAAKEYWAQFQPTPELVVLFLPAESFLCAAFDQDPALVEHAFERGVVLATPMTLMSLLKAVAYGWKQQAIADNAIEVSHLGAELYKRLADMGEHVSRLGASLENAVGSYNRMVGSLESRVLVSARRFKELGATAGGKEVGEATLIESVPRPLLAEELKENPVRPTGTEG